MRARAWVVLVAVLLGCLSLSGRARASGGDVIFPDEAVYVLIGVPIATNLLFTSVDIALAVEGKHASRAYAGTELGISGAQLLLLTTIMVELDEQNPYLLGYAVWTAGLASHGLVSLVTAPDPSRPKKVARSWDVVAAPIGRGQGGSVSLTGVW